MKSVHLLDDSRWLLCLWTENNVFDKGQIKEHAELIDRATAKND